MELRSNPACGFASDMVLLTLGQARCGRAQASDIGVCPLGHFLAGESLRQSSVRIVKFREMVDAPEPTVRQLFDFAGLPWAGQTGEFIFGSRSGNNRGRYYGFIVRRISSGAPTDGRT